ncbi:MAG: HIT domain-containing protein [Candidatus Lindowbacteria bacterium]|nr:HIT domain-containing protein [Candidatus Lindowbacteria bacterium]
MDNCIFCKIIKREIPSEIVGENDGAIAFRDNSPQAPAHLLVIPKNHIEEIDGLPDCLPDIFQLINEVSISSSINKEGFRIVMNKGEFGGQQVDHLHFHVLGGRQLQWPPG